jgi:cell wall-associated NlpC family hydrolase
VRSLLRGVVLLGLSVCLIAPSTGAQAAPSAADLTQQINKSSTELSKIVESYNRLNEEIKTTKTTAANLAKKMGPLQQQVEQSRLAVGQIAADAYKTGGLQTADALLSAGSPDNVVARLDALNQLAHGHQKQIAGLDQTQRQYLDAKANLDATLARQNAQAQQLAAGKTKIEADLAKLYSMRQAAYGSATSSGGSYSGPIPSVSGQAGVAVRYAYGAIGAQYTWAASGPYSTGYDCSGLTAAAWQAAGKSLPHNAAMQWDAVAHISRSALQPGDLVFYSGLGHVAIYVGGGQVIHAPDFGVSVRLASVDMMSPYGYGRVR